MYPYGYYPQQGMPEHGQAMNPPQDFSFHENSSMVYQQPDYLAPHDFNAYDPERQRPQELERRINQLERRAGQIERENDRQSREITRLNNQLNRTNARLTRVNQRLRFLENRFNIPFTPFDGEF